jgi:hypothetical protein
LGILKYAAWAGWALFVISVIADVATRLRGLPVPRLGPQQQLATQLVGAVLALAVSVPTTLPATAIPVQQAPLSQPGAASTVQLGVPVAAQPVQATDTSVDESFEEYRVRRGDCLWDIAWNELGEPERWPEIYEASRSVRQPGGGRLTDPDLIVTGWVLHIPAIPEQSIGPAAEGTRAPASDPPSVVTPFRKVLDTPRGAPLASPAHGSTNPPVRTALSTPVAPGSPPSVLEVSWTEALRRHDSAIGRERGWRDRLALGSYGS